MSKTSSTDNWIQPSEKYWSHHRDAWYKFNKETHTINIFEIANELLNIFFKDDILQIPEVLSGFQYCDNIPEFIVEKIIDSNPPQTIIDLAKKYLKENSNLP